MLTFSLLNKQHLRFFDYAIAPLRMTITTKWQCAYHFERIWNTHKITFLWGTRRNLKFCISNSFVCYLEQLFLSCWAILFCHPELVEGSQTFAHYDFLERFSFLENQLTCSRIRFFRPNAKFNFVVLWSDLIMCILIKIWHCHPELVEGSQTLL